MLVENIVAYGNIIKNFVRPEQPTVIRKNIVLLAFVSPFVNIPKVFLKPAVKRKILVIFFL